MGRRSSIGLQISFVARDQISALPGLGVLDRRQQQIERVEILLAVRNGSNVFVQLPSIPEPENSVEQQQRDSERNAEGQSAIGFPLHARIMGMRNRIAAASN